VSPPTDIVVIGAGIIGCATAYELARRGVSVQVVDDRPAGMGATQASAGVLAPYIEARDDSPLLELTVRSLDLFDKFVARVSSVSGLPVTYRRTGTLDIATEEDTLTRFEQQRVALSRRGITADVVDAAAVRREEPQLADGVLGGLLIPAHGYVVAGELTRALAAAARRHGAQLIEHGRVKRIAERQGELVVETERGPLAGNGVVIAAGSWSGQIEVSGVTSFNAIVCTVASPDCTVSAPMPSMVPKNILVSFGDIRSATGPRSQSWAMTGDCRARMAA